MAALIDDKTKACRKARSLASDLVLYYSTKLQAGLENDNFYEALEKELDEARAFYKDSVTPEIYSSTNYLERAIMDKVLAMSGHIKTKFW